MHWTTIFFLLFYRHRRKIWTSKVGAAGNWPSGFWRMLWLLNVKGNKFLDWKYSLLLSPEKGSFATKMPEIFFHLGLRYALTSRVKKKPFSFPLETKELSCFSQKCVRCFFNHFSCYLFSFLSHSSNLSFFFHFIV